MNKKLFIEKYAGKAVNCKTEKEAEKFFEMAANIEVRWLDGDKLRLNDTRWEIYEEETCYRVIYDNDKLFIFILTTPSLYSPIYYYQGSHIEIVSLRGDALYE